MQLIEITNVKTAKDFLLFPVHLYKNVQNWIRPLDNDIKAIFDPKKNLLLNTSQCIRWILKNNQGVTIGRIAAFVNNKTKNKDNEQPTGGIGFFECINDQTAATFLFDTSKKWLEEKGMEAMDGPINFGNRDAWWGLLVDGFDIEPNYKNNYHFSYYQQLFENYGFKVYFKQFTFGRNTREPLDEKLIRKAKKIAQDPNYTFRHIEKNKLKQSAEDFRTVYNDAWAGISGVTKMSSLQANLIMKKMKSVIDEKIIWFAYYKETPVAFCINLPELNQIFKHLNGNLNWFGKIRFLYYKLRKNNNKMTGIIFGVSVKHQGKGIDGALIDALKRAVIDKKKYSQMEMAWIGDFNTKMLTVMKQLHTKKIKTHHTYRYLFDRTNEFKRSPIKN